MEYTILDAVFTDQYSGYCIGRKNTEYVTWWFALRGNIVDYYHGHYFRIDPDAPMKSHALAMADFYSRTAQGFRVNAKFGG